MRIISWNVNGIRANLKKNGLQRLIADKNPDIVCIQETKAKPGQAEVDLPEYEEIWNSADRPGYSGTAIFTKIEPLSTSFGFSDEINKRYNFHDEYGDPTREGRVLTVEYEKFFLVTVYTPNSKPDLTRLKLRENFWDPAFLEYVKELEKKKPVVFCGDFNAAHTEIDLARPDDNTKNAGFTKEERQGITNIIDAGFIDTFRNLHPNIRKYTWWTFRARARERNIGWRIDYFFISQNLKNSLKKAEIYEEYLGSDHCPIEVELSWN